MQPEVSIIIVYYHAKEELLNCIKSIIENKPRVSYEIIVVDNDKRKRAETELKQNFPSIKYIKSKKNLGFGSGVNLGAKRAKGKYLFILNPDTIVNRHAIDLLVAGIKSKDTGICSPQLLDKKGNVLPFQCSQTLTPIRGLLAHSLINRLFPNNPISREFWISSWDRKTIKEVEAIQGSALMIKSKLFHELGGFDESYFMYFEETDLCLRVKKSGKKILFEPKAKIIHLEEKSTTNKKLSKRIFKDSRSYYFKKNFGIFTASIIYILFFLMERWKIISIFLLAILVLCLTNKL